MTTLYRFLCMAIAIFCCFPASVRANDVEQSTPTVYYTPAILDLDPVADVATISKLDDLGIKVIYSRDNLHLAFVPDDEVDDMEAYGISNSMRSLAPARKDTKKLRAPHVSPRNFLTMKNSLQFNDTYKLLTGEGLTMPYDGTGVVVGFCDVGFDPTHINFLTADGTASRVKRFVKYKEYTATRTELDNTADIYASGTDDAVMTHATHVAGILTGAYNYNGYRGIAPGADIVATCSELTDVGILAGVEDIIAYAKAEGKPAVINISVGNLIGPHDGTSLFCQYLDKCCEDAIICISTANSGNVMVHSDHTFTSDTDQVSYHLFNESYDNFTLFGKSAAYSDTDAPLRYRFGVLDDDANAVTEKFETIDFSENPTVVFSSHSSDQGRPGYIYSPEFAKYFTGRITLESSVSKYNNRFGILVDYDCTTSAESSRGKWARYGLVGYVSGDAGTHARLYADGNECWFREYPGIVGPRPTTMCSVSDMATGHNTVSVGMMCNGPDVKTLGGSTYKSDAMGAVDVNSSYGTDFNGTIHPRTVAPGVAIVSSMNGAYVSEYPSEANSAAFKTLPVYPAPAARPANAVTSTAASASTQLYDPTREYYWFPMGGTSMATPYTAGCIATWLQADPSLTYEDVHQYLALTNDTETHPYSENPRNGQGRLQPYVALQAIVKNTTTPIEDVLGQTLFMSVEGKTLRIVNPELRNVSVEVYSMAGIKVSGGSGTAGIAGNASHNRCNDGVILHDLSGLSAGVYTAVARPEGASPVTLKLLLP